MLLLTICVGGCNADAVHVDVRRRERSTWRNEITVQVVVEASNEHSRDCG